MTKFEISAFTKNELRAATILLKEALAGMGGSRPSDFEDDEYTWCEAATLIPYGWSRFEAAGTYGSLAEKNVVYLDLHEKNSDFITGDFWRWADSVWEEIKDKNPDLFTQK